MYKGSGSDGNNSNISIARQEQTKGKINVTIRTLSTTGLLIASLCVHNFQYANPKTGNFWNDAIELKRETSVVAMHVCVKHIDTVQK